jgi:hypothetical protein
MNEDSDIETEDDNLPDMLENFKVSIKLSQYK